MRPRHGQHGLDRHGPGVERRDESEGRVRIARRFAGGAEERVAPPTGPWASSMPLSTSRRIVPTGFRSHVASRSLTPGERFEGVPH